MLYDSASCPCMNATCDLYRNCKACIERHHASAKYPMTACEICEKEDCERADPVSYFKNKGRRKENG